MCIRDRVITRLERVVQGALPGAQPLTQVGIGTAEVKEVASNRRILDSSGKVAGVRYTTCKDPVLRAAPEGVGPGSDREQTAASEDGVTDSLFQGGSPRWREVTVEPGGGARRRSNGPPHPTRAAPGATERHP